MPPQSRHARCRLRSLCACGDEIARLAPGLRGSIKQTHLVVHLQRVALSSGLEVPGVGVYGQVDLLVKALDVDRVPVLVIQQAAHGHGHAAAAEPGPAVVCREAKQAPLSCFGFLDLEDSPKRV